MIIKNTLINTGFNGEKCFTHGRGVILENGFGLITTQPLRLTGMDVFYGMYLIKTYDGGKSWSELKPSSTIVRRRMDDGSEIAFCDGTPMLHKATGRILLLGHYASYINDEIAPDPRRRHTVYAVYDEKTGDFSPFKILEMPEGTEELYYSCGNGSGQSLELENGELLIPIYYNDMEGASDPWHSCSSAAVMRCSFDGENIQVLEVGNGLTVEVPRGLGEPSVVCYNDEYILALRNDETGYVAKGTDGIHYGNPMELVFDDGENLGNYCTQQHWIKGGGRLYMVYTRRGADNDHVFRHRAPLFIAEFDTERMCVLRESERIAVPNRGARLGNFGCHSADDGKRAFVFASEWMQTTDPDPWDFRRCMEYGSDNSIFVSEIIFE